MPQRWTLIPILIIAWGIAGCAGRPAEPLTAPPSSPIQPAEASAVPASPSTPTIEAGAAQTEAATAPAEPVTATPTPTPPPVTAGPTFPPPPTETPTLTLVPTVVPPTLSAPAGGLPAGWLVYSAIVYLDPANPNPSTTACHLHVVRLDGSADRDLTPDSHDCVASPVISPDGQWIAFLSGYGRNMSAGFASHIVVVSADGAQTRSFDPRPLSLGGLRWSKDGTRIAYYFEGDFQWHVIDAQSGAAGETLSALTTSDWFMPNLSPDGQYRASACTADQQSAGQRVCVTSSAADSRPFGPDDGGITWSPDGQWISYVVQDGLTTGDKSKDGTYLMHPDGSGAVRISAQISGAIWFETTP